MLEQKGYFTRRAVKGFKGTVVNQTLPFLHGESLEITLTVPLISKFPASTRKINN